ncbi:MAG: hypothetical protein KTR31_25600 [Myxococcales bacterium]|nr:hypothetical protein [Myxococcales bacterium]
MITSTKTSTAVGAMVLALLASGCERQFCGKLLVGGGQLELTLRQGDDDPLLSWTVPGVSELPPRSSLEGAMLDLPPDPTDWTFLYTRAEATDEGHPCDFAKLVGDVFLEFRRNADGEVVDSYVEAFFDRGNGGQGMNAFQDRDSTFTLVSEVQGSVSAPVFINTYDGCPTLDGIGGVHRGTLELSWHFDPEVQHEEVALITGRCNRAREAY